MQSGFICAAGIDTSTGKHVRPCLANGNRLDRELFLERIFDIGSVVDLGPSKFAGRAPQLEDHIVSQPFVKLIRREDPG